MEKSSGNRPAVKIKNAPIIEDAFRWTMTSMGWIMIVLLSALFITLFYNSIPSIKHSGFHFLVSKVWNPVVDEYGAIPFIAGTLLTSILALIISMPFSLSLALILGEFNKKGILADIFRNVIELMAGVPSVIYGFAALYFLTPVMRTLELKLGYPPYGVGVLSASIVLAIMIIPYWASVAREVISLTPKELKEASYSLGATRFETIMKVIIPNTKSGIIAGMLLAFGRAIGETMAVTMVIGNTNKLPGNIFAPANTMASVIANEFTEATTDLYLSALIEIALLLFVISMIINLIGKQIIKRLA